MRTSRPLLHRFMALLGALLLVPLVAVLGASPAQAAANQLTGAVDAGLGNPLAGVTVDLLDAASPSTVVATTSTGADGSYVLPVTAGSYQLRYSKSGYDTQLYAGGAVVVVDADGQASVGEAPVPDNVLDDTTLTATPPAGTHPVTGAVSDANGEPIVAATVTAAPQTGTVADHEQSTSTDSAGEYALDLQDGTYRITISRSGFASSQYPGGGSPAVDVVVSSAGVTAGGISAPGGALDPVSLVGTTPYALSGTVIKAGGTGLVGITVTATPADDDQAPTTAVSGTGGTFTFSGGGTGVGHGLVVGSYTLTFVDNTANPVRYLSTSYGNSVDVGQDGVITVNGAAAPPIRVTMSPVPQDARFDLAGLVSDPNGDPIDGVTVTATPVAGTAADHLVTGVTGADPRREEPAGAYRLAVLPGKYHLTYAMSGYQTATLSSWEDGSTVTVSVGPTGVLDAPGLDLLGGIIDDVTLYRPAAPFATNPRLTGTVAVGQTLTVSFGSLQGATVDPDFVTVEWFLDGEPADDFATGASFQKFKVLASAAARTLTYRVTIEDPDGMRAPSVFTGSPVSVPKAPATVSGKLAKGKLTIILSVPTLVDPLGTLTVKDGKKTVATIRLAPKDRGKAVVPLKLTKGKHKLTISYSGTSTTAPASTTLSTKVR